MQISINQDQVRHLKNTFFKNINDAAKNEYEKASWYLSLYKLVGQEGFGSFLSQYFNYTADQVLEGEKQVKLREMFTSCRLWMRVGGRKGIEKLSSVTDEEKRTQIVDRINKPKGIVNYTMTDLDNVIESDSVDSKSVMFFDGYTQPRSEKHSNRRNDKRNSRKPKRDELLVKLSKSIDMLARNSKPKSKGRSRSNRNRQPVTTR
jgi:hypothetical protein